MSDKIMVATLCGSTRFKSEFKKINKELTLEGWCVFSCAYFGHVDGFPSKKKKKILN